MKDRLLHSILAVLVAGSIQAQTGDNVAPRLVVGLTIDQLRTDYIEAFTSLFGERGFKRLMKEGRYYQNAEYSFIHVDQASAAAAVYTGTTPYYNGIPGECWMDRNTLRLVKGVDDTKWMGIYTKENSSPARLEVSTLTDELMVATGGEAEVWAIAPTREMAVLTAGHAAKGAFWVNDDTGKWCGSTYYGQFPKWATHYNDHEGIDFRINDVTWEPKLAVTSYKYVTSVARQVTFKHNFGEQRREKYRRYKTSPFINDEVNRLVNACLSSTSIGRDDTPDMLALSYYAGNYAHKPISEYSMEIQDTYVRLDNSIGDLIDMLERKVGLKNVLIFITSTGYSDPEPVDPKQFKIPGGEFYMKRCGALLNMYLMAIYGQGQYVETQYDQQIYLNHKLIEERGLDLTEIMNKSADFVVQMSGVKEAYTSQRLSLGAWNPRIDKIRNSFRQNVSGDLYIEVMPGWTVIDEYSQTEEVVRECYNSVPLILFGGNIKSEVIDSPTDVAVIAPTVANCLRIRAPNASTLAPLNNIYK